LARRARPAGPRRLLSSAEEARAGHAADGGRGKGTNFFAGRKGGKRKTACGKRLPQAGEGGGKWCLGISRLLHWV